MSLIKFFKKDSINWDKLSLREKVELLRIDVHSYSSGFGILSLWFLSLSVSFFLCGLAIFYPYLERASYLDAGTLTASLFKNGALLLLFFAIFYLCAMGFMIYNYFKKKKVVSLD